MHMPPTHHHLDGTTLNNLHNLEIPTGLPAPRSRPGVRRDNKEGMRLSPAIQVHHSSTAHLRHRSPQTHLHLEALRCLKRLIHLLLPQYPIPSRHSKYLRQKNGMSRTSRRVHRLRLLLGLLRTREAPIPAWGLQFSWWTEQSRHHSRTEEHTISEALGSRGSA